MEIEHKIVKSLRNSADKLELAKHLPEEVQLHGYHNEHYPSNHYRKGEIPQKVRDFVNRWESEVLIPTVAQIRKDQAKKQNKRRKENAA